jgi:hypothetical protein
MGGTCITCERDERLIQNFCGNLKERDHFEDLGMDGRILKLSLGKQVGTLWTGFK